MDINQLSKINTLSSELRRHGMAENSTAALQQAEEIVQVTAKTEAKPEAAVVEAAAPDKLVERQFLIEIEKLQKLMSEELDTFRNAINQVIIEVNNVRDEVGKMAAAPQQRAKETQAVLTEEKKIDVKPAEPHPRQGNLTSKDVDIQKMFYFGNK